MTANLDVIHKTSAFAVTQHAAWTVHLLDFVSDMLDDATYREEAIHDIHDGDGAMLRFVAGFRSAPAAEQTSKTSERFDSRKYAQEQCNALCGDSKKLE